LLKVEFEKDGKTFVYVFPEATELTAELAKQIPHSGPCRIQGKVQGVDEHVLAWWKCLTEYLGATEADMLKTLDRRGMVSEKHECKDCGFDCELAGKNFDNAWVLGCLNWARKEKHECHDSRSHDVDEFYQDPPKDTAESLLREIVIGGYHALDDTCPTCTGAGNTGHIHEDACPITRARKLLEK
jgi:hypothetical protein